jgi:Flp pilus assembly pilin Flp
MKRSEAAARRRSRRGAECREKRREKVNRIIKMYERVRKLAKGQTMTEYALILAAIAIVVFIAYETMGNDIKSLVSSVDSYLTAT